MSFNASFKGTVSANLWVNATVAQSLENPPNPLNTDPSQVKDPSFIYDQPIIWPVDTPNPISSTKLTINDIINDLQNNEQFIFSQNYIYTATTGSQDQCSSPAEFFLYSIGFNTPPLQIKAQNAVSGCIATYNASTSNGNVLIVSTPSSIIAPPDSIVVLPYSQITGFTLNLTIEITLSYTCDSSNFDTGVCLDYCTTKDNIQNGTCLKEYSELCFTTPAGATGPIIFENNGQNGCYTFFETYLTENSNGPSVELDDKLSTACSFLQIDQIVPFYQAPTNNIQNICACHLNAEFYKNLQKEIAALPGGNTVDLPDVCLFQPCVNPDSFPRVLEGKTCPVAPCIILADIENNGNIKGGTTINQSCLNTKATIEKYLIILVPVGIIVLFVIIVILFLVFREI